jgi:hypothetical protein
LAGWSAPRGDHGGGADHPETVTPIRVGGSWRTVIRWSAAAIVSPSEAAVRTFRVVCQICHHCITVRWFSERTKAALAVAKSRSVKLGGDRGYRPETLPKAFENGAAAASAARSNGADHVAHAFLPLIEEILADGHTSLKAISAQLTARGVATANGGAWTATTVRRMPARISA